MDLNVTSRLLRTLDLLSRRGPSLLALQSRHRPAGLCRHRRCCSQRHTHRVCTHSERRWSGAHILPRRVTKLHPTCTQVTKR